jgi:hypothetical protein
MATNQSSRVGQRRPPSVRVIAGAVALISLTSLAGVAAAKGGHPLPSLSVTTVIEDVDANNVPYTIESDGSGAYTDGVGGVSSILTSNVCNGLTWGDWRFDSTGASRSVSEGFFAQDAVQSGDPHYQAPANPPYTGLEPQHSVMNVQCTCTAGKDMYTMAAGAQIVCPLINHWLDSSGDEWGLAPAKSFTGYTETTDAQITCNAVSGGHCVDWFIEPIGAPTTQAVGRAVETIPGHPRDTKIDDGDFYMRFRIHVMLP